MTFRFFIALLCFWLAVGDRASAADPKPTDKADAAKAFVGKVLPLGTVLAKQGIKIDPDAASSLVLVLNDGSLFTLVKDDVTRLLFLDKRLHDKQLQLTAKQLPGTQVLHVTKVQSLTDGKVFDIIYWCDNCQFANTEPGPCKCCGGDTILFEVAPKQK